jgi:hydrogenase maturation factor HypF (carbamoyltransferase family)
MTTRVCDNCRMEYKIPDDQRHDWSPCCSIGCNGASRLRELGWTIEQSFQVMNRGCVAKMVRNVFDMHEFELCLKKLANDEVDRLQRLLDTFSV